MDTDASAPEPGAADFDQAGYLDVETITDGGQEIRVRRPIEGQPAGTVPLPGQVVGDTIFIRYENINDIKRRPMLVQLCKDYGLRSSGKRDNLREQLVGFSENPVRWRALFRGATRAHRGIRKVGDGKVSKPEKKTPRMSSTKSKKLKLSVIRRNELMGLPSDTPLGAQIFGTERSKDTRTLEQKNSLLQWADKFCETHPYVPFEEIQEMRKAKEEAKKKTDPSGMLSEYMRSTSECLTTLTSMVGELTGRYIHPMELPLPVNPLPSNVSGNSTNVPASLVSESSTKVVTSFVDVSSPSQALALPASSAMCSIATSTCPAALSNTFAVHPWAFNDSGSDVAMADITVHAEGLSQSGCDAEVPTDRDYILMLGHGQVFRYKKDDIPDPSQQISFANNIDRLGRVWNDETPNWDASDCGNLLSINGTPIALRYWSEVYKRKKDKRWDLIKSSWTEWKFVAERYCLSSPDGFWAEFTSENGERLNWKAICSRLRAQRGDQEQVLADQAKAEYGTKFSNVFVNRGKVLQNKSAIARRYLALKNNMDID